MLVQHPSVHLLARKECTLSLDFRVLEHKTVNTKAAKLRKHKTTLWYVGVRMW